MFSFLRSIAAGEDRDRVKRKGKNMLENGKTKGKNMLENGKIKGKNILEKESAFSKVDDEIKKEIKKKDKVEIPQRAPTPSTDSDEISSSESEISFAQTETSDNTDEEEVLENKRLTRNQTRPKRIHTGFFRPPQEDDDDDDYNGQFENVLFFGDSITWGMAHNYTGRYEKTWPSLLKDRLRMYRLKGVESALCSRTTALNDPNNGEWMSGAEDHFFNGLDHFLPEFVSCTPKWLVLLLGTNDLRVNMRMAVKTKQNDSVAMKTRARVDANSIAKSCARIALKAREFHCKSTFCNGDLNIIVVAPPLVRMNPLMVELGYDETSLAISKDFVNAYRQMCKENGFLFAQPDVDMSYSTDGIHVTQEANSKIAESVWAVMQQKLGPVPPRPPPASVKSADSLASSTISSSKQPPPASVNSTNSLASSTISSKRIRQESEYNPKKNDRNLRREDSKLSEKSCTEDKRSVGRPRNMKHKRRVGRPRKSDVGRSSKRPVGRPRKSSVDRDRPRKRKRYERKRRSPLADATTGLLPRSLPMRRARRIISYDESHIDEDGVVIGEIEVDNEGEEVHKTKRKNYRLAEEKLAVSFLSLLNKRRPELYPKFIFMLLSLPGNLPSQVEAIVLKLDMMLADEQNLRSRFRNFIAADYNGITFQDGPKQPVRYRRLSDSSSVTSDSDSNSSTSGSSSSGYSSYDSDTTGSSFSESDR